MQWSILSHLLNHKHDFENAVLVNTVLALFVSLSRCIADDYNQRLGGGRMSVDWKLSKLILEKKEAMGVKGSRLDFRYINYHVVKTQLRIVIKTSQSALKHKF